MVYRSERVAFNLTGSQTPSSAPRRSLGRPCRSVDLGAGWLRGLLALVVALIGCSRPESVSASGSVYDGPTEWRDGYLLQRGGPDPWACETDAECVCAALVDPDGCCRSSPHPFPQTRAYASWLGERLSSDECREVTCPPAPLPAPPLPCAYEARCLDGRCSNACHAATLVAPPPPRPISGDGYIGVVLDAADWQGEAAGSRRWTPSDEEVARAEGVLASELATLAGQDDGGELRVVQGQLAEYRRYYVGVLGDADERLVWISMMRGADSRHPGWQREMVVVRGGGTDYVQARVSLDEARVVDVRVNSGR
jgi:hypothetical protein